MVLRAFVALLGVAALLFNAALMLSDRAPGAMRSIFGDSVRRLSERLDRGGRVSALAADGQLPEGDAIVHIAVWAVAIGLVGLAVWTWIGLVAGAAVVFACSLVVEYLQGRLTDTRAVERSDIAANAAGIMVGAAAVAVCYLVWSGLAIVFARTRYEA